MQTTTFKGSTVNLAGNEMKVGDKAPLITAVGTDLSDVTIGGTTKYSLSLPFPLWIRTLARLKPEDLT